LRAALLTKPGKIFSLEALRGFAALSVVSGHLCAGFEPFRFDPNAGGGRFPLAGTPLFISSTANEVHEEESRNMDRR